MIAARLVQNLLLFLRVTDEDTLVEASNRYIAIKAEVGMCEWLIAAGSVRIQDVSTAI